MVEVTVDLVKKQVGLDGITSDDAYLQYLIDVAEDHVLHAELHIESREELISKFGVLNSEGVKDVPPRYVQLVVLTVASLYAQREGESSMAFTLTPLYRGMVRSLKKLTFNRKSL